MVICACTFLGSGLTPDFAVNSPKNGLLVHQKRHLYLLSFKFACLHILRTLLSLASWFLSMSSNPAISAMPKCMQPLVQLINFFLKHIFSWCHTKWQSYVSIPIKRTKKSCMRIAHLALSCGTLSFVSVSTRYLTPANLGKISLRVEPCELVWSGLCFTVLGPHVTWPHHLPLGPAWSCYTISVFYWCLGLL